MAFADEFLQLYKIISNDPHNNPFRNSRYYERVGDLRPFGLDVILHNSLRLSKVPSSKLEILDVGKKTLARILEEVSRIVRCDPLDLGVMRIDLAVDVADVEVYWFQQYLSVGFKRLSEVRGENEFRELSKADLETLYFGKRPNIIRVYNKHKEQLEEYRKRARKFSKDQERLSFEEIMGFPSPEGILTRVERQIGGGRIPPELLTLRSCRDRLPFFDPFKSLRIEAGGDGLPPRSRYSYSDYASGKLLHDLVLAHGNQVSRKIVNEMTNGQAARKFKKYPEFVPNFSEQAHTLTVKNLVDLFHYSVMRQISA